MEGLEKKFRCGKEAKEIQHVQIQSSSPPHLKKTKQDKAYMSFRKKNNFLEIKKEEKKIKIYILKGILYSR